MKIHRLAWLGKVFVSVLFSLAVVLIPNHQASATPTYYVAPNGQDVSSNGSIGSPFLTIGYCASQLTSSGGTCILRSGTYRENARIFSNTLIQAYQSSPGVYESVIVTGLDNYATLSWTSVGNNVWKANVDFITNSTRLASDDIQLFMDNSGSQSIEARWPNINGNSNLLDNTGVEESVAQAGTSMTDGIHGHIVDSNIPSGINLIGAVVRVRGGLDWAAHTGVITGQGTGYIDYVADNNGSSGGLALQAEMRTEPGDLYYITRAQGLLDQTSEFFYDKNTKDLYIKLAAGDNPSSHSFQSKMRELAFDLGNTQNSRISHLSIKAASINMDVQSSGNILEYLNITYLSHYVRAMEGPYSGFWAQTGIHLWGSNETLTNSTLMYSAGSGVSVKGNNQTITNNTISFIDYSGHYDAPIFIDMNQTGQMDNLQILNNTISSTGRDGIFIDGWPQGSYYNSRIAFNDISQYGKLNIDLGGIYICCDVNGTQQSGQTVISRSVIDHNFIHDANQSNPQSAGIMVDNQSHGFVVAHNVLWNNVEAGLKLNGFASNSGVPGNIDMTINNNTFFTGQTYSIMVNGQAANGLQNTFISNNIFVTPTQARTGCASGICNGATDYGSGGNSNYYGNPGFASTSSPFDWRLLNGVSNPASFTAAPIWTDTSPTNDLCPSGTTCGSPVAPSFGAYNTNGYLWSAAGIPVPPANPPVNWYSGWSYRKPLTINHTKISGTANLTNFPVLVSVIDPDLRTTVNGGKSTFSGGDIVFTASDGITILSSELEKYTATTGEFVAWVKIPSLSPNTDTAIHMYYGGSSSPNTNPTSVWDSNFKGVWHLKNGTTLSATDSTSNANNGTITGPTATNGQVDGAANFVRTSSQRITKSANSSLNISTGTISFWTKPSALGVGVSYPIVHYPRCCSNTSTSAYELEIRDTSKIDLKLQEALYSKSGIISAGSWQQITVTFSGSTVSWYKNGVLFGTATQTTTPNSDNSGPFSIGGDPGLTSYYNGDLDELRISNAARSADWVKTEYNNESLTSTFYTAGGEESLSSTPTVSFSVSPTTIQGGASTTLTWSTSNATSVSINNGVGSVATSGTLSVTPSNTTTYTLTATNVAGSTTAQATVTVNIDTTAPVTSFNMLTFLANASDAIGVLKVEFYANSTLICTDTAAPYTCDWPVPATSGVMYSIQTKAYDAANNIGQSTVMQITP